MTLKGLYIRSLALLFMAVPVTGFAQSQAADLPASKVEQDKTDKHTANGLLSRVRLSTDARLRYQFLDVDGFDLDANSATLRVHSALEFDLSDKTTFLVEGEAVTSLIDNFNDGTGNNPQFPAIPDPSGLKLNRLQLTTSIIPKTRITLGRQRIAIDDSRFIGVFNFRQNDQTIDAIRAETRLLGLVRWMLVISTKLTARLAMIM